MHEQQYLNQKWTICARCVVGCWRVGSGWKDLQRGGMMAPTRLRAPAQALLLILLHVSNVTCRPSSGPEDRLGSVLDIPWPFESLENAQGSVGDNVVSVEDVEKFEKEKVLKREVVNQNSEVIRRPVVRLGSDNLPYVFYADNEVVKVAKVVRKMMVRKRKRKKKVVSAPPLDIRSKSQRRRPKLVLMNSEGQAMPPILMHLNDRIAPVYSFMSRFPKRQRARNINLVDKELVP